MKKYVQIHSTMNVSVAPGLQYVDYTERDSDIPDRFKVSSEWARAVIDIKIGQHWYPAEISTWDTTKALAKDGLLTIGIFADTCDEEDAEKLRGKIDSNRDVLELDCQFKDDKLAKARKKMKSLAEMTEE